MAIVQKAGGARAALYLVGAAVLMIGPGTPVAAQTTDPGTGDEPPPNDTEPADPDSASLDIDLGEVVVVGPDGSVRWNVENDNGVAEGSTSTPPAAASRGTEPTESGVPVVTDGDPDVQPVGAGDADDDAPATVALSGTGSNLALLGGIAGGAVALLVGLVVWSRSRRRSAAEFDVIEDAIDPLAPMSGEFPSPSVTPAYAGAEDAGAYDPGGAAYAQHTEAGYAVVADDTLSHGSENRLDQLRSSMVNMADKGLAESGQDLAIAKKLEAAGSKMRPGEWIVMVAGATLGALFGGAFVVGWLIGAFAAVLVAMGFWMALGMMETKRQKLFSEALPETLGLIAGSLRGGFSMLQAIGTVAEEADEPTAEEFQRIVAETRLGRDTAVALRDLSTRMGSKDFEWVATAIEIHREVGGDLAKILDRVSDTIRSRNRVRGQVKALSAEGRASGIILFLLPPGMVLVIATTNRPYIDELLSETEGQIMVIAAAILLLAGGLWLRRLSRFVY